MRIGEIHYAITFLTLFLNCSTIVKMALGMKFKLGFVEGNCKKPNLRTFDFERWIIVDYMV